MLPEETTVHQAAEGGGAATLEALLARDPKLATAEDERGLRPLHLAARAGNRGAIEVLLRSSVVYEDAHTMLASAPLAFVEDEAADGSGRAALHMAVACGHCEAAAQLMAFGASPLHKDDNLRTALHLVPPGGADVCRLLLGAGAEVNAQDEDGCTPLHRVLTTHPSAEAVAEVLLGAGASLFAAAEDGTRCIDIIRASGERMGSVYRLVSEVARDVEGRGRRKRRLQRSTSRSPSPRGGGKDAPEHQRPARRRRRQEASLCDESDVDRDLVLPGELLGKVDAADGDPVEHGPVL